MQSKLFIIFFAGAVLALAQSDEVRLSAHDYVAPQMRLSAQSELVQVEVVVRDRQGKIVGGLRQSDFDIRDEGKRRAIETFSTEVRASGPDEAPATAAPPAAGSTGPAVPVRSTVLFFDDIHGDVSHLQSIQAAAERFIADGLGPRANVAVYSVAEGLKQSFSADADALIAAVRSLHAHPRIARQGQLTPYQAYVIANHLEARLIKHGVGEDEEGAQDTLDTTLAKAIWEDVRTDSLNTLAAINGALALLSRQPGTRTLLLGSEGFISGTLEPELDYTIRNAIRSGVVINTLDAKALVTTGPHAGNLAQEAGDRTGGVFFDPTQEQAVIEANNAVLAEAAMATGGVFFHNSNDLAGGFSRLGAVPQVSYLMAFKPEPPDKRARYRKLKVRVAAKEAHSIQARRGYYVPAATEIVIRPLDEQATKDDVLAGIPIDAEPQLARSQNGEPVVRLRIHVDIRPLQFAKRDGRRVQKLTFIGAMLNRDGDIVSAKEGEIDFALKDNTLAELSAEGVNAWLSLPAPAGRYRLRVVVQDADGKLAALNQSVEISN